MALQDLNERGERESEVIEKQAQKVTYNLDILNIQKM